MWVRLDGRTAPGPTDEGTANRASPEVGTKAVAGTASSSEVAAAMPRALDVIGFALVCDNEESHSRSVHLPYACASSAKRGMTMQQGPPQPAVDAALHQAQRLEPPLSATRYRIRRYVPRTGPYTAARPLPARRSLPQRRHQHEHVPAGPSEWCGMALTVSALGARLCRDCVSPSVYIRQSSETEGGQIIRRI